MQYRLRRLPFFVKGNCEVGLSVCVFRLNPYSRPTVEDRSVYFPVLKKYMTKNILCDEVVGPNCQRFFVMTNRVVDSSLLDERVAEGDPGIWIIRLHRYRSGAIDNRLIHLSFVEKGVAKIVIGLPKIRLQFRGRVPDSVWRSRRRRIKRGRPTTMYNPAGASLRLSIWGK